VLSCNRPRRQERDVLGKQQQKKKRTRGGYGYQRELDLRTLGRQKKKFWMRLALALCRT
jgi:hypothetical protein